ncbi:acetyl-CoA acetyltransferase, partial [Mycobacterium sp. ITM-2017-0098]
VLEAVDAVRVVNLLSWRYRDPGLLLAQRLRAKNASTRYTGIGAGRNAARGIRVKTAGAVSVGMV